MTLAGLKKCVPMTISGREVTEAISSMSSVEVLEARMQSGRPRCRFGEEFFLERHAFEDGFDDDVGLIETVVR